MAHDQINTSYVQDNAVYNAVADPVDHEVGGFLPATEIALHDRYSDKYIQRFNLEGATSGDEADEAEAEAEAAPEAEGLLSAPPGNASAAEWRAYAVSRGMDPAAADEATRSELQALYDQQ